MEKSYRNEKQKRTLRILLAAAAVLLLVCAAFCGAGAAHHEGWKGTSSLPTTAGSYYLTADITISSTWIVPPGETNLCLNGHVIKKTGTGSVISVGSGCTLNLYDCDTTTVHYFKFTKSTKTTTEGGTFEETVPDAWSYYSGTPAATETVSLEQFNLEQAMEHAGNYYIKITGGCITGGKAARGAGVYVTGEDATFTMNGGNIVGNYANSGSDGDGGGGINAGQNATLELKGGKILGNRSDWYGGGVLIGSGLNGESYPKKFSMEKSETEISHNWAITGGGISTYIGCDISGPVKIIGNTANGVPPDADKGAGGGCFFWGGHGDVTIGPGTAASGSSGVPQITDNICDGNGGGGIAAESYGANNLTVTISGAAITGNKITARNKPGTGATPVLANGGGAMVKGNTILKLNGNVTITGNINTSDNNRANNVYHTDKEKVILTGALTGGNIGIYYGPDNGMFGKISSGYTAKDTDRSKFVYDKDATITSVKKEGHESLLWWGSDNQYTVTFKKRSDGTNLATEKIYSGHVVTIPSVLTKEGKKVTCYTDQTGSTLWDFSTPINTNTTIWVEVGSKEKIDVPTADQNNPYTYTGDVLTYTPDKILDDKMTVSNNTQTTAGEYTVTVSLTEEAKKGYEWNITDKHSTEDIKFAFTILPKNIAAGDAAGAGAVSVDDVSAVTYSGEAYTPDVVMTYNGKTLVKDTDYTLAYTGNTDAGIAKITITGKGNYTGTRVVEFTINQKNISDSDVTVDPATIGDLTYTGEDIKPTITEIKYNGTTLTPNTDYTLAYSDNKNVGTAKITITGKGNYTGTRDVSFKIIAKSIADGDTAGKGAVTVDPVQAETYDGTEHKPDVVMKYNGETLTKEGDKDYTLAYANNKDAGTATITITGKGNYTGTRTTTFTINPKSIADSSVTVDKQLPDREYTGDSITQDDKVIVKDTALPDTFTDKTLKKTTDYTLGYADNTEPGTATITITGMGNYGNSRNDVTFNIIKRHIANCTIEPIPVPAQEYTGYEIKPAITIKNGTHTLTEGTDYTVTYTDNIRPGTATITITGIGDHYDETTTLTFTILPGCTVTYNGNGATGGAAPVDSFLYPKRSTATVRDSGTLERAGYVFAGWAMNPDETGTIYQPEDTFTISTDVTLYAVWEVGKPIVTFDGEECEGVLQPYDGKTHELRAESEAPGVHYLWWKDGVPMPEITDLKEIKYTEDSGVYTIIAVVGDKKSEAVEMSVSIVRMKTYIGAKDQTIYAGEQPKQGPEWAILVYPLCGEDRLTDIKFIKNEQELTVIGSDAKIMCGDVDVTHNYDIEYVAGKLTVKHRSNPGHSEWAKEEDTPKKKTILNISEWYDLTAFIETTEAPIARVAEVDEEYAQEILDRKEAARAAGVELVNSRGAETIVILEEDIPYIDREVFTEIDQITYENGDPVEVVEFTIPKIAVTEKGLTTDDVTIYHYLYDYKLWTPLETSLISDNGVNLVYQAPGDGADRFAILIKKTGPRSVPITEPATTPKSPAPAAGILAAIAAAAVLGLKRRK